VQQENSLEMRLGAAMSGESFLEIHYHFGFARCLCVEAVSYPRLAHLKEKTEQKT